MLPRAVQGAALRVLRVMRVMRGLPGLLLLCCRGATSSMLNRRLVATGETIDLADWAMRVVVAPCGAVAACCCCVFLASRRAMPCVELWRQLWQPSRLHEGEERARS